MRVVAVAPILNAPRAPPAIAIPCEVKLDTPFKAKPGPTSQPATAPTATEAVIAIFWRVIQAISICKGLQIYPSISSQNSYTLQKASSLLKTK